MGETLRTSGLCELPGSAAQPLARRGGALRQRGNAGGRADAPHGGLRWIERMVNLMNKKE